MHCIILPESVRIHIFCLIISIIIMKENMTNKKMKKIETIMEDDKKYENDEK